MALWPYLQGNQQFFSLSFFVFSSTSILNCSIFFFLEKGFWFRFCPRQLTTNCPTQLQRGKPWVKEIPYGNVSRNAVLILKQILCKANSSRVLIRKSRLGFFYWISSINPISYVLTSITKIRGTTNPKSNFMYHISVTIK